MYMNKRYLDILFYLYKNEGYVTGAELSTALGMSTKTITREMKKYSQDKKLREEYGFYLRVKQGHGYRIEVMEQDKFVLLMQKAELLQNPLIESREHEIIRILLKNDDFITIAEIAEELYISSATVSTALKNVRMQLEEYNLKLHNRPSVGIRIEGSEMNKRLCMSKFFLFSGGCVSDINFITEDIEKALTSVLKTNGIFLSDIAKEHLEAHISISIERIQEHHIISIEQEDKCMLEKKQEYQIAKELVSKLNAYIPVDDQKEEIYYIAIQLMGKRSLTEGDESYQLSEDIEQILRRIFKEIHMKLGIDLTADKEVLNYLAMHFEPMLFRLKYGIKYSNPLLHEVKTKQATSFEMGLIAKTVIQEEYQYTLDDNEVSCLALYFSLASQRLFAIKSRKRVLVVCGLGVSSSRILIHKLRQQFSEFIKKIEVCQYHSLEEIDLGRYDCILSTVEKPIYGKLPVLYLTDFLSHTQDEQIRDFLCNAQGHTFQITAYLKKEYFFIEDTMKNEKEAITYIVHHLKIGEDTAEELIVNVMEREALSSTAYGNFCAMPHPIRMCTEENVFSVLILKRGMLWGGKRVKCIFFLSPSRHRPDDLRHFNEALASFILDTELFSRFLQAPDFQLLKELLEKQ